MLCTRMDLKLHLISTHQRLRVICAWCKGEERWYRRAVDLRDHVRKTHPAIFHETKESLGEPNCFYLSETPHDYRRVIIPTKPDTDSARYLKRAVETLVTSIRHPTRSLAEWRSGWSCIPLLERSPSPLLDYEDTCDSPEMKIHDIAINAKSIKATLYQEGEASVKWLFADIDHRLMTTPREREALFRRMLSVEPFHGVVPQTSNTIPQADVDTERARVSTILGVLVSNVCRISEVTESKYASKRKRECSEDRRPSRRSRSTRPITPNSSADSAQPTASGPTTTSRCRFPPLCCQCHRLARR